MPSKKQLSQTLSFSKKNKDIYDFLLEKKKDETFVLTDYICECVRFHEKYKFTIYDTVTKKDVMLLIEQEISKLKIHKIIDNEEKTYSDNFLLERSGNIDKKQLGDD